MHVAAAISVLAVLGATIYLVARFPGSGSVASVIMGWGVITFASQAWQNADFTEGWSLMGWIPMIVWCFVLRKGVRFLKGPNQPDTVNPAIPPRFQIERQGRG